MPTSHPPPLVTPLVALIFGREELYAPVREAAEGLFGPVELESPVYPFDKTAYYTPTMGADLKRRFLTFERLADSGELAAWKLAAIDLEARFAREFAGPNRPPRPVNIDPGYITGAKLVLASTKDFAHRIYLHSGIFAEITLAFRKDSWVAHEHTFPDFRGGLYDGFLKQARDRHLRKAKSPGLV